MKSRKYQGEMFSNLIGKVDPNKRVGGLDGHLRLFDAQAPLKTDVSFYLCLYIS